MKNNIRLYLGGVLISQLGSHLFLIAMSVWLMNTYGTTKELGNFLFLSSISTVIISPFAGVLIDRFKPKKMMILSDIICGLMMLLIYWLMIEGSTSEWRLSLIYGFTFISSIMIAIFTPSSLTLASMITSKETLRELNGKVSNLTEVSKLSGRALAGLLLSILMPKTLILLNGISFLLSAIMEFFISVDEGSEVKIKDYGSYFQELKEGFSYLCKNHLLIGLFLGASLTNFFIAINGTLLPVIIKDNLKFDLWWLGIVMSGIGAGALVGGYVARKINKKLCKGFFSYALVLQGLPFFFIPFANHPITIFSLMALVGLFYVFVQVNMFSIVSKVVETKYLGRVFSLMFAIITLFMPISYLFTGYFGSHYQMSILDLYHIAGIMVPIVWIITLYLLKKKGKLVEAFAC